MAIDFERLKEVSDMLEQKRNDIQKEIAKEQAKQQQAKEMYNKIKKIIDRIIDIKKIRDAKQTMKAVHQQVGSNARDKFDKAQEVIHKEMQKLQKNGLQSIGLNKLYFANFNTPNRDNVSNVTDDDIYNVHEIID